MTVPYAVYTQLDPPNGQVRSTFWIKRYDASGILDGAFGSGGQIAVTALSTNSDHLIAYDSTAQRVVIVGNSPDSGKLALMRIWL